MSAFIRGITGRIATRVRVQTQSRATRQAKRTTKAMGGGDWAKEDTRRMLHAVYRVGPMDEYCKFMDACFGMKQLRYRDIPEEKYTNAFIGFGPETTNFCMELTYNYGVDSYDIGTGFGHFGLAVTSVVDTCDKIKAAGYEANITRPPGPVKGGKTQIAFVKDPAGFSWELIERPGAEPKEPLAQVMLRVTDLDRSIEWYVFEATSVGRCWTSLLERVPSPRPPHQRFSHCARCWLFRLGIRTCWDASCSARA
jgi:lactoylglutathione lyase